MRTLLAVIAVSTLALAPLAAAAESGSASASNVASADPAAGERGTAMTRSSRGARGQEGPARERGSTTVSTTVVGLIALITVGALAWWKRRKQPAAEIGETIELLAQSSLGGRTRAMWLRAGERDMVVAVTAQAVQVLAAWPNAGRASDASDASDAASFHEAPGSSSRSVDASLGPSGSDGAAAHPASVSEPRPAAGSFHPRRPAARSALRAARLSGSRCRPSYRRRGEEDLP